jgi:hypothetical protein
MGFNKGQTEPKNKVKELPSEVDNEAANKQLLEVLERIFWRYKMERRGKRFLIFDPKTGRQLAFVSVSSRIKRNSASSVEGMQILVYKEVPTESQIRSDLSAIVW